MLVIKKFFLLFFFLLLCRNSLSYAQATPQVDLVKAQQYFAKSKFDKAIKYYKRYLRKNKQDYEAWAQLGASYYHTGVPRRGLRYLKMAEAKTPNKAYDFFYQGLCYDAIGDRENARESYKKSANFPSLYGGRSMFELGVTDYKNQEQEKSYHWLALYVNRYPKGRYRNEALRILNALRQGIYLDNVSGVKKPDANKALYKYNKLSLMPTPHFWLARIGSFYQQGTHWEPKSSGGITQKGHSTTAITADATAGIGPIKKEQATVWAGYNYKQQWYTEAERINEFTEDFDLSYQPFRPDLLEREHELYFDLRRKFGQKLLLGVFSQLAYHRLSTSLYTGPETETFDLEVQDISDTTLFIPWIGFSYDQNHRTLIYLYFRKEINSDSPDFSNKTYNFSSNTGDIPLSFGLTHTMNIPKYKTDLNLELFKYDFISNDYWNDYVRIGFNASVEHQVLPRIFIQLLGGYYQDSYIETILRQNTCETALKTEDNTSSTAPSYHHCDRNDSGYMITAKGYWNYTQFHRISAEIQFIENQNETQQEYSTSDMKIIVSANIAFPSVKRVLRFSKRFADSALTKSPQ